MSSSIAVIGVFIVSGHRLFGEALALLLDREAGFRVTGIAADLAVIPDDSDVLLIDTAGYAGNGHHPLALLRGVRERREPLHPIVLGVACEDERLIDLIEAGAQGYVLRGTSPAMLMETIRAVHRGCSACSPLIAAAVVTRIIELERCRPLREPEPSEPLTAREREVLAWLATGRCNKEIGQRLHISVRTVKNHVHSILAKLGARRRREALRIAYELGLLSDAALPPNQPEGPLD
jgi:DNA-binding NarL/FixJ family response regulator